MLLYKSQSLSFIESKTLGIYHASSTAQGTLGAVQNRFLREVGLSPADAVHEFNLAPLSARRDVAMLGLIHRTCLGEGPPGLQIFVQEGGGLGNSLH